MATENDTKENETSKKRSLDATIDPMLLPIMYRLTKGLPRRELKLMIEESKSCEQAILEEIEQLEKGLGEKVASQIKEEETAELDMILESDVTPADTFYTVSALVGRLRADMAVPLPPNSTLPEHRLQTGLVGPPNKKKKKDANKDVPKKETEESTLDTHEKRKQLLALEQNPEYTKEHATPTALLALWKKISNHRASIVFRRPVNPKEAPGYAERIVFPMDLGLVRKKISARMIKSYADLHQHIGLIAHNCMKFNGRESDYGVVARDFEANADEFVLVAVATGGVAAASSDASKNEQSSNDGTAKADDVTKAATSATSSTPEISSNDGKDEEKATKADGETGNSERETKTD